MGKLRVAIVAPSLRILGGQAVQADRLLQAWRDDPEVRAWLVPVNPLPPRPLRRLARVKYVRTLLNEILYGRLLVRELAKADVVHVFSASYSSFLLAPLPAIVVARALGRPVVLNYRSGEAPDHLRQSAVARAALARVERNVVPSRFLVEVFARFGIEASVIPNIVDFNQFRYRERAPLQPRFVSTRNFDELYNVACTLRAFRLVQDRHPEATLTLVGAGPEEARLRRLAAELSLSGVTFAGRVAPDAIDTYYAANDVYVQSPNIDNMPTSVLEAYASGLPVVSTEAGGVPAMLTHDRHGLLAPIDDHETLGRHMIALLDDPDRARRLARHAFDSCRRCSWSAVRDAWVSVYRSVLPAASAQATPSPTHAS